MTEGPAKPRDCTLLCTLSITYNLHIFGLCTSDMSEGSSQPRTCILLCIFRLSTYSCGRFVRMMLLCICVLNRCPYSVLSKGPCFYHITSTYIFTLNLHIYIIYVKNRTTIPTYRLEVILLSLFCSLRFILSCYCLITLTSYE